MSRSRVTAGNSFFGSWSEAERTSAPSQRHSETSQAAAEAIETTTGSLRRLVYLHLIRAGHDGLTDEELIEQSGITASTCRPRRIELVEQGRVRDSGRTRLTRAGRKAVVWEVVEG